MPASATWFTTNISSGSGNAKIIVTTTTENIGSERSASLVITPIASSALQPISITIRQKPAAVSLVWAKQYGGSKPDFAICLLPTPDGGFLSVGLTESNDGDMSGGHGGEDEYIMKVDGSGNRLWTKVYGGSDMDQFIHAVPTADGGYILAGMTKSRDGDLAGIAGVNVGTEAWAMKIDGSGNKIWNKVFGGARDDHFEAVVSADNGHMLLVGRSKSNDRDVSSNKGVEDGFLVMIDGAGNKLWSKTYGGSAQDIFFSAAKSSDGGYLLAGITASNNGDIGGHHGGDDVWVMKVDAMGTTLWSKAFGGSSLEHTVSPSAILPTANGGCVITGEARSNDGDISGLLGIGDAWVLSLDGNGNKLLSKVHGGSLIDAGNSLLRTSDGGYLVLVHTQSIDGIGVGNQGNADIALLKLDANGNKIWSRTFGGPGYEQSLQIIPTTDGSFAITGTTVSNGGDLTGNHGAGDIFIMKVKAP